MATIKTTLTLQDGMSAKLRTINVALDGVVNAIKAVERAANGTTQSVRNMSSGMGRAFGVVIAQQRQMSTQLANIRNNTNNIANSINNNTTAQRRFNNELKNSNTYANKLWLMLKRGTTAYFGMQGAKKVFNIADQMTNATARINMMPDVTSGQTTSQEVQDKIYAAAMRSRGSYSDMMDSVSKLSLQTGDLFGSSDEVIGFMEQFNKMAVVSGANAQQTSAALLQLTQAMASGELRGDELRSVRENMPVIMQAIAEEMGVTADKVLEMGYNGEITSEVLKRAFANSIGRIDELMKKMPYTWDQVWQTVSNFALKAFTPIFRAISALTSNKRFIAFANGVGNVISAIAGLTYRAFNALKPVLVWIYDALAGIYNFFKNNWSIIAPIVLGIAAAYAVTHAKLALLWVWTKLVTAVTWLWHGAQTALNVAMSMNPVGLIILAIIILIAAFYAVIAAINKFTGTSISATGWIAGAFMWLWAVIKNFGLGVANVFIGIYNIAIGVAQWCVEAWNWCANNMGSIFSNIGIWWSNLWIDAQIGFNNFISSVLSKLASLAEKVAPLADVLDIDLSGITNAVNDYSAKNASLKASKQQYKTLTDFNPNVNWNTADYFEYDKLSEAFNKGNEWGSGLADKVSDTFSMDTIKEKLGIASGEDGKNDIGKALTGGYGDNPYADALKKNTGDIAKNTSDMIDASDEELSFMKDMAEREAINRYTLRDVKLNMTNNNNITKEVDADAFIRKLEKDMNDYMFAGTNGAHV